MSEETPEGITTEEGLYEKWIVDVDIDGDGEAFESPQDIDIHGLDGQRLIRALFPITKETPLFFLKAVTGSCGSYIEEGFKFLRKPTRIEFDDNENPEGLLKFNCKIQQLKNILYHRRTDTVYVLGTLD